MSLNFYYCKGDGFHAVIEERNEKFATEYFVYLMNEMLEPEKGISEKDVTCEQVNVYSYKAAEQSVQRMRYAVRKKAVMSLPSCFIAKVMRLSRAPLTQAVGKPLEEYVRSNNRFTNYRKRTLLHY